LPAVQSVAKVPDVCLRGGRQGVGVDGPVGEERVVALDQREVGEDRVQRELDRIELRVDERGLIRVIRVEGGVIGEIVLPVVDRWLRHRLTP
jgi:hypothetical protein